MKSQALPHAQLWQNTYDRHRVIRPPAVLAGPACPGRKAGGGSLLSLSAFTLSTLYPVSAARKVMRCTVPATAVSGADFGADTPVDATPASQSVGMTARRLSRPPNALHTLAATGSAAVQPRATSALPCEALPPGAGYRRQLPELTSFEGLPAMNSHALLVCGQPSTGCSRGGRPSAGLHGPCLSCSSQHLPRPAAALSC